jgi:hypothetical protein
LAKAQSRQLFPMSDAALNLAASSRATFFELFTPKLVTVFREGYGPKQLRADAFAGLTVAIVALSFINRMSETAALKAINSAS